MKKTLLLLIASALIAVNLSAQLSLEGNQILYLNFDDEADLSYNDEGINVTDEAGIVQDEGVFGGSAWFDGDGSYIVFDPIDGWNHGMDWSFSFWVKSEIQEDFFGIMSFSTYSGDPLTDWMDEEPCVGGIKLSSWEGYFEVEVSWLGGLWSELDPPLWNDGEWHHVVIAYDGDSDADNMYMYMDNVLYAEPLEQFNIAVDIADIASEGTNASVEDDNIKLGLAAQGWNDWEEGQQFPEIMWFNGYMDDVRLFNTTLTAENVTEIFNYSPTGVSDWQSKELFAIYPNPASDIVQIQTTIHNLHVKVYNIAGQVVISSVNETSINLESLSKGMYFVDINVEGKREVQKLIIK